MIQRRTLLLAGTVALAGCASVNKLLTTTPEGALFCTIATANGGQITAQVNAAIDTVAAQYLGPLGGVAAVIVTGQSAAYVQAACDAAARATGGVAGLPQSPPPAGVAVAPVTIQAGDIAGLAK